MVSYRLVFQSLTPWRCVYRNYSIFSSILQSRADNFSTLFNGVVEGYFGAAFAGGGGVGFIVIDDAVFTVVYHLIVALDVGGSA